MRFFLLFLLFFGFSTQAFEIDKSRAELDIKFGGWSHHFIDKDYQEEYRNVNGEYYHYNENHRGLGFEISAPFTDTNHYISTGLWYMEDSNYVDAFHFGISYKYRSRFEIIHSIDYTFNIVAASRGFMHISYDYEYQNINGTNTLITLSEFNTERKTLIYPMPQMTFNITKQFHIDVIAMVSKFDYYQTTKPDFNIYESEKVNYWNKVLFFRFGFKF